MALSVTSAKTTTSTTSAASTSSATSTSLSWISTLAKMLPTGVIFIFQILSNFLSHNGDCRKWNKILVGICLGILGIVCFILSFTDSFTDSDGKVHYGIATKNGIATIGSGKSTVKPSKGSDYQLTLKDFLGAGLSVIVFAIVSLTDKNVVSCLYPSAQSSINKWIQALPVVVSAVTSVVFVIFPSKRQGISHPVTTK